MTNKQLIKKLENACVVCRDCGLKYGVYSVGCSSVWEGKCGVCDQIKPVTETRDYAYLMTGIRKLLKEDIKEQSKEVAKYILTQEPIMTDEDLDRVMNSSYKRGPMTNQHPITPPPELVSEWAQTRGYSCADELWDYIATKAARWGADQELEACCNWLGPLGIKGGNNLRAARRPKPPSLKEQALGALNLMLMFVPPGNQLEQGDTIRRALEALPND